MKIFGIRIIREKTYKHLLKFKNEVEEILRKKLPVISDKIFKNKNINFFKGVVLINSSIQNSKIEHKLKKPIKVLGDNSVIYHNIFK